MGEPQTKPGEVGIKLGYGCLDDTGIKHNR